MLSNEAIEFSSFILVIFFIEKHRQHESHQTKDLLDYDNSRQTTNVLLKKHLISSNFIEFHK